MRPKKAIHFVMGRVGGSIPGSFCLQPAISKEMREQIARLEQDPKYSEARRAILDRIKQSGWRAMLDGSLTHPDPSLLTTLACAIVFSDHLTSRESLDDVAVGQTGKTWKALREFPQRIECVAREIEKVNAASLFAPENQIDAEKADAECFRQAFRDVPAMLRAWSKALKERIIFMRRFDAAVFGDSDSRAYLQFLVKEGTGKPNDSLVADLLNAAAEALGRRCGVDATSLAKARFRRRKKSPDWPARCI